MDLDTCTAILQPSCPLSCHGTTDNAGHIILEVISDADLFNCGHEAFLNFCKIYKDIFYKRQNVQGFTLVLDLRLHSKEILQDAVRLLNQVNSNTYGISVIYIIQPQNKDVMKHLKKLMGASHTKKGRLPSNTKTCLLADAVALHSYIDRNQLTEKFGGFISNDQSALLLSKLKKMANLCQTVKEVLSKVPEAKDKLQMFQEYDDVTKKEEAQEKLVHIRNKYQTIMRDLKLEDTIDQCKSAVSNKNDQFKDHNRAFNSHPLNEQSQCFLSESIEKLITARETLKELWLKAEKKIMHKTRIYKYTGKVQKILSWLEEVGFPTASEAPEIADCLSKSEILKNHFETGFLSIAKNVLWFAEKVLGKVISLQKEHPELQRGSLSQLSLKLQHQMKEFRDLVTKKQQLFVNIHNFYLSSQKVSRWFRRSVKFLPLHCIAEFCTADGRVCYKATYDWTVAVKQYLKTYPAPKPELLQKLRLMLPVIDSVNSRNQARLLMQRVKLVKKIFSEPSKVNETEMMQILEMKEAVNQEIDGIDQKNSPSSWDLASNISGKQSASSLNPLTPKLQRNVSYMGDSMRAYSTRKPPPYSLSFSVADRGKPAVFNRSEKHGLVDPVTYVVHDQFNTSIPLAYSNSNYFNPHHIQSVPKNYLPLTLRPRRHYGIYGDKEFMTQEQFSSPNYTELYEERDRYIPLNYNKSGRAVPDHLRHIDVAALEDNLPQTNRVNKSDFCGEMSDDVLLRRHNSMADSGIIPTRSVSTNSLLAQTAKNLSGILNSSHMPLNTVKSKNRSLNSSNLARSTSHLLSSGDIDLELTQANIDYVANSDLSPEEKLDLMAAMCQCDDPASYELPPKVFSKGSNHESGKLSGDLVDSRQSQTRRPRSGVFNTTAEANLSDSRERLQSDNLLTSDLERRHASKISKASPVTRKNEVSTLETTLQHEEEYEGSNNLPSTPKKQKCGKQRPFLKHI